MCGIYGTTRPYSNRILDEKMSRTNFRGPDQTGIKTVENNEYHLTFGHNRLSIIDLDKRSNQPFLYNGVWIVFNGEIFNFQDLKSTLAKKGHKFSTTSDTEVICALYLEYGQKFVSKMNGMFAFVIYDSNKKILFGARDRLGQKPFYYIDDGNTFEFASQISSITLGRKDITISKEVLRQYLLWSYVPEPDSIFNGIKKLLPGHQFEYSMISKKMEISKYWEIPEIPNDVLVKDYKEARLNLRDILQNAVKIRLFADVPVGVFLSGGVDSSLVAALATKATGEKVNTFSVKFDQTGFDESKYAQDVATHLGTNHHTIECDYNEGLNIIDDFAHYYDEPFADSSAIPSMLLSKYTKRHVTVALSGDGGDEFYLGYHRYNWFKKLNYIFSQPRIIRKSLVPILNNFPNYRAKIIANVLEKDTIEDAYLSMMNASNAKWLTKNELHDFEGKKWLTNSNKNLLERVSDFDIKTYLNWDINTKVDRASMAYSLEVRSPLMDYRVVEFSKSIPTYFKYKGKNQKRILKDLLYEMVPEQFFDRPKAGFTMPFKEWFKNELKEFVLNELNEKSLSEIPFVNQKEFTKMINQHMQSQWNHYPEIWKLLVLKKWLNKNNYSIK